MASPLPAFRQPGSDEELALRDATAVAERVRADEAAADAARARYLSEPLAPIAAPVELGPLLDAGERLLVVRPGVLVELPLADSSSGRPVRGDLCLTNRRVLIVDGHLVDAVDLGSIAEIGVVGDRTMQVSTSTGTGLAIELERPRLLRVQIQAARDRTTRATRGVPQPDST